MKVENSVFPTSAQIEAIFQSAENGPFAMLNMLKFKSRAVYESGEDVSGRDAYMRYAAAMRGLVEQAGGRLIYSGAVVAMMVGEVEQIWDAVAIVEYPSRAAFRAIVQSPHYHAIEKHRLAGLEGQLNIETKQVV